MFVLTPVVPACMGRTFSYESRSSISVVSYILADFHFFQITYDHLILCFLWSSTEETAGNFEGSTFSRPITLFHSFQMARPLQPSIL